MHSIEPAQDDGLIIPEVGFWSKDKHHFLGRYIDAFTTAMKDKRWSGLHYIDLFAGPGIERIEGSGILDWGSPLIAAQAKHPFTTLHLCEMDRVKFEAQSKRVKSIRPQVSDQLLIGDANERIHDVIPSVPPRTLSLAFLDPFGLHLDFETLRALASIRADLIIFFPDRLDIDRNWKAYYWDNLDSNLDAVLGANSNWREKINGVPPDRRLAEFWKIYEAQLSSLGHTQFEREPIPSEGARLYWLIFCSKAPVAAGFWRRVSSKKRSGQRTMDFDTDG